MGTPYRASGRVATAATALLVCVGYYLGTKLGLQLRLPPATPSVLWPPNAILTSALLLTVPRQWLPVLLAALPAHLVLELQTGWPLSLILALFVTNCLEAVIAAGVLRLLGRGPLRFDTFRGLGVFFAAIVLAAPILSSFADAGAVSLLHGEAYWQIWRNRTLANVLAELTIVPAIVGAATGLPLWWRNPSAARAIEATVLAAALILTGVINLNPRLDWMTPLDAMSSQTPLAIQLPFLLWATVRFGPAGGGMALLVTTTASAWAVVHGRGPFAAIAPSTTVPALSLSLIVVAAALLSLSTLIEERRHIQQTVAARLRFEEFLSRVSRVFVQLPSDQMGSAFVEWLPRLGEYLDVDCLVLIVTTEEEGDLRPETWWTRSGFATTAPPLSPDEFPWLRRRLLAGESVIATNPGVLPAEAGRDRRALHAAGLRAGVAIPLTGVGHVLGALAAGCSVTPEDADTLTRNLRLVGEVLANGLARKRTEDALRRSELMKSAILTSLTTGVVVVSRDGRVLARNDSNVELAQKSGCMELGTGGNLLEELAAADTENRLASEAASAVFAVLNGSRPQVVIEHVSGAGADRRWWSLLVVPLNDPEGGAVLTQTDVTALRRAELEAQESRLELAHVARVSTMGELTASLAHQLNQPLAAIRTNAQVARRLLDSEHPDMTLVTSILADIIADDKRASDVIQGLRDLLRKGGLGMARVDLAAAVRDVAGLINSESIMRNVQLSLNFSREPVFVVGNRVQIQQVVLNLLQNAMEAMSGQDPPRLVTLQCRSRNGFVLVSVRDCGPGFADGAEQQIFDPFYTTKPGGMGMGLAIVRSIVEAHGGEIRTATEPGWTVVEFSLPAWKRAGA
jgi:signal transduction histidine kinase/integral membrane sensor domain MASE1